jgi:hypothetical protein
MGGAVLWLLVLGCALGWSAPAAWAQAGVPATMELTLDAAAVPVGNDVKGYVKAKDAAGHEVTMAYDNGTSGATTTIRIKVQIDAAHSTTVDAGSNFTISTSAAPALAAGNYTVTATHVQGRRDDGGCDQAGGAGES